jgi:hypothetical protein
MIAVLCSLQDIDALRVAAALRARSVPHTILTVEALSFAERRTQRLDDRSASSEVALADGTELVDGEVDGVVNRMVRAPADAWGRAPAVEREYATAELHAFALSWLSALPCPVRNRPSPGFLGGPSPHPAFAVASAAAAGLLVAPLRLGRLGPDADDGSVASAARRAAGPGATPIQVPCLDGGAIGDVPEPVREALPAFAAAIGAGDALIGVDFVVQGDAYWFAGVTPLPRVNARVVDALLDLFAPVVVP